MYALCQAHLNGVIDPPQFLEEFKNLRVAAFDLIKQEIPSIETKRIENAALRAEQARDAAAQSATGAKTSQTEAAKSAEAAAASAAGSKK
jgi:hypothetical protein